MVLASLMLLQIFTETIAPKAPGQCVAVVFKRTAYIAKTVERSRFTGRLLLKMRGAQLPPSTAEISACGRECVSSVALTDSCVASCAAGPEADRLGCARKCPWPRDPELERLAGSSTFTPILHPRNSGPVASCEYQCLLRTARFVGRDLELASADAISNPSRCSCNDVTSCVDK